MNVPDKLVFAAAATIGVISAGYSMYQSWRRTDITGSAKHALDKQEENKRAQDATSKRNVEPPSKQTKQTIQSSGNEECLYVRNPGYRMNDDDDDTEIDGDIGTVNRAPVVGYRMNDDDDDDTEIDGDIGTVNRAPVVEISNTEESEPVPNDVTEPEVPANDDLRYDILILNAEDDETRARQFQREMEGIINLPDVSIVLYVDYPAIGQSHFRIMSDIFNKCRYLFIFVTRNFTSGQLERYQHEMALMDSIQNPEKKNRVIPVWAESGANTFLQELSILHGIDYQNTERPANATLLTNLIKHGRRNVPLP